MKKVKFKNRYGDLFTFTPTEDGNILWEGNFKWCRFGWPNNYEKAFAAYMEVEGNPPHDHTLSLEEFKEEVHRSIYDSEDKYIGPCEISKKYAPLVYSEKDKIDMVDPSGGPFMTSGMKSEFIHPEAKGKVIERFEPVEKGYLIILKDRE